jgi:hypothetical protein
VDYDVELFEDDDHQQPTENEEDDSEDILEEYDGMDENEMADIMDAPHGFNVPDEANRNEETIVEQDNDEAVDGNDDNPDYEDSEADDESFTADEEGPTNPVLRRTDRVRTPNPRYQHLHISNKEHIEEYNQELAQVIGYVMTHFNYSMAGMNDLQTFSFLQTSSLNQGLKRFGERGRKAAH